jgi:hypothetical protein
MMAYVIISNLCLTKLTNSFYLAAPTSSLTFPVAHIMASSEFQENSFILVRFIEVLRFNRIISEFFFTSVQNKKLNVNWNKIIRSLLFIFN